VRHEYTPSKQARNCRGSPCGCPRLARNGGVSPLPWLFDQLPGVVIYMDTCASNASGRCHRGHTRATARVRPYKCENSREGPRVVDVTLGYVRNPVGILERKNSPKRILRCRRRGAFWLPHLSGGRQKNLSSWCTWRLERSGRFKKKECLTAHSLWSFKTRRSLRGKREGGNIF
jgi:hypothetical protein